MDFDVLSAFLMVTLGFTHASKDQTNFILVTIGHLITVLSILYSSSDP
jgi:hypothetical protein